MLCCWRSGPSSYIQNIRLFCAVIGNYSSYDHFQQLKALEIIAAKPDCRKVTQWTASKRLCRPAQWPAATSNLLWPVTKKLQASHLQQEDKRSYKTGKSKKEDRAQNHYTQQLPNWSYLQSAEDDDLPTAFLMKRTYPSTNCPLAFRNPSSNIFLVWHTNHLL